ncbi:MAG: hypothetical protein U5Q44_02330 [Dehalococcoidia bacterium]|nr:hypothetical protein [Dehalococcoidia bacterium]
MIDIFPVEGPWRGPLAVCARPRPAPWLHDDLRNLRREGYGVLVSALTAGEIAESRLHEVEEACREHGIRYANLPIANLGVPEVEAALPRLQGWLEALREGTGVAMHCFGSVGRGPTLVHGLLVLEGVPPAEAWHRVQQARGREVPDTHKQRQWVHGLLDGPLAPTPGA